MPSVTSLAWEFGSMAAAEGPDIHIVECGIALILPTRNLARMAQLSLALASLLWRMP